MPTQSPASLAQVDWAQLPAPKDDGAADHLRGMALPDLALPATIGGTVRLRDLSGLAVIFAYPRTGQPGQALPDGWDMIPGARGCTPQACSFRDLFADLRALGVDHVFGLSTQDQAYQAEAATRLHLPYALLSDADLALAQALRLPTFEAGGAVLLRRLTMMCRDGVIEEVIYPVFPPDQSAAQVVDRLARP